MMAKELLATIYLNKDTDTAKSFGFDSFNESVVSNTMTLSVRYDVSDSSEIPDFSGLKNLEITAMEIADKAGNKIPYFGSYSKVDDVMVNYFSADDIFTVNITLC